MSRDLQNKLIFSKDVFISKAGYFFSPSDRYWRLDKNNNVRVIKVIELLDESLIYGYMRTLIYYAEKMSAGYAFAINERMMHLLRATNSKFITDSILINYRSQLDESTEYYLGTVRTFLNKWYELGYNGISTEIIDLLNSWVIRGCIKGDLIKRLDPLKGPLSDVELQAFNEGAVQAFERGDISLTDMALGLIVSNTGRRQIQVSHLRIKDVLKGDNHKGEPVYLLNIPRAKQRATKFREEFKQFAITHELWVILTAQTEHAVITVEKILGVHLQVNDRLELPLFPDSSVLSAITSIPLLREALKNDRLHIKSGRVSIACKMIADSAQIFSERTGESLNISSRRFRYTTGTRAAREGFGEMVIAELLDHSDNQNAGVYIENIPEHVESLDKAVGHYMARYAQAFAGILVDSETSAVRGNDLTSRIKIEGESVGTCGSYGFCGANVPIPCYTCLHFQPWLDGPHTIVYEELIAERKRLIELTNDMQIAAVNDRSILAVADVIQRCAARREELANG